MEAIAIDVNRRGEYAIVTSLGLSIPDEINKINQRLDKISDKIIPHFQSLIKRTTNEFKKIKHQFLVSLLYDRKKDLRTDYHRRLIEWLGCQMGSSKAETLVIEDLNCHTYGTKGALAKAIESMADETSLYAREVYAISIHDDRNCKLVTLDARNSSRIHVDCGGQLKRDFENYDFAPCSKCKQKVNTHANAASFLLNKFQFDSVHSPRVETLATG